MAQPEFTSGPWKLETESRSEYGSCLLVTTPDGAWNIADCRDHSGLTIDSIKQAEANACLISAAPDLYAALHELREAWCLNACDAASPDEGMNHLPECEKARAALSKAEGRDAR